MEELKIYEKLKEAYETTTPSNNRYLETIKNINWDDSFIADDEYYYTYGGMLFTTQSLNPFDEKWKPSVIFSDGSSIEF